MSRRGRRGKAADSVEDTTESPQRAIFKLQLRSQDPEFKPSLQTVAGEYATRYLEQLGVDPSKQTLDLVHAHVPLTDKCITTTLRSKGHVTDSLQLQAPPVVLSTKVPQVISAHAVLRLGIANQEAGTEEDGPQAGTAGVQGGGSSLGAALPGSKFKHLAARYLHPFYLDPGLVRQQLKLQQREVPRELGGRGVGGVSQDGQDAHGWDPELLKAEVQHELAQELHVSPEVVLTLLAQLESALTDWHRHQAPETLKGRLTPQDFKATIDLLIDPGSVSFFCTLINFMHQEFVVASPSFPHHLQRQASGTSSRPTTQSSSLIRPSTTSLRPGCKKGGPLLSRVMLLEKYDLGYQLWQKERQQEGLSSTSRSHSTSARGHTLGPHSTQGPSHPAGSQGVTQSMHSSRRRDPPPHYPHQQPSCQQPQPPQPSHQRSDSLAGPGHGPAPVPRSVSFPAQPLAPPPGSGAPAAAATNSTQLFHQQEWQQHCLTSLPPALQPADGNLAAAMASTAICPLPLLAPSRPPSHPSSPSHPYLASSSRADSPEQQGLADDSWSGAVGSWSPGGLPSRRAARSLAHLPSVKALASAIAKGCRDDEGVVGPEEVAALQRARLFVMQQFFSRLFSQQRTRRAGMFFRLPIFLVAARLSVHLLFSGLFGLWTQTAEGVDALEQMDAAMVQLFDPHGYMQRNLSILQSSPAAVSIMTHHPHKSHENERSHFSDVSPTLRAALPEPASAEARRLLLAGQHAEAARALAGRQRSRGQAAAQAVPQGNGEASCTPATCSVLKTRLNKAQQALLYNEAVTATAAGRDKSQDIGGHPTAPEHWQAEADDAFYKLATWIPHLYRSHSSPLPSLATRMIRLSVWPPCKHLKMLTTRPTHTLNPCIR